MTTAVASFTTLIFDLASLSERASENQHESRAKHAVSEVAQAAAPSPRERGEGAERFA